MSVFSVSDIGSPLQNQIAVMKVEFETSSGGAAGGELTVTERSSLGSCSVKVRTNPGETAAQIATAVANAFQAPGVPGSAMCPAIQNPRDITVEGSGIVSVLASELRVCNSDQGLGFFLAPKELPNTRRLSLQYAAKFICGVQPAKSATQSSYGGWSGQQLATGSYYTVVNIHNPTDKPAAIRFKFATALPGGKPGPISRFFDAKLKPDEVISIDCSQLFGFLQGKASFADGFAVIESEVELDVVAVYTAAGVLGKAESLTIERIPARLQ